MRLEAQLEFPKQIPRREDSTSGNAWRHLLKLPAHTGWQSYTDSYGTSLHVRGEAGTRTFRVALFTTARHWIQPWCPAAVNG